MSRKSLAVQARDIARHQTMQKLRGYELLEVGQRVWFLCAKECEGCENSEEPIIDPRSFSWIEGTVVIPFEEAEDGLQCARVRDDENGTGLYERRFIVTETEAAMLRIPMPK